MLRIVNNQSELPIVIIQFFTKIHTFTTPYTKINPAVVCAEIFSLTNSKKRQMSVSIPKFPPIGMSPDVWGPLFWKTMHIVSLGYNPEPSKQEQDDAIRFFKSLETMLPCNICRSHYSQFMREMPIEQAVGSRDTLIYWVFQIHNKVNAHLGKREITFEEYIQSMKHLATKSSAHPSAAPNYTMLMLIIAAIVGGAAFYYTTKK